MANDPAEAITHMGVLGTALFTVLLVVATAALGYALGRRRRRAYGEGEPPVGSIVGATLGLLAFMMAFTFGMAAARHDARRALVREHANAIGTAALRADFLPAANRTGIRTALAEYVACNLAVARDRSTLDVNLARAEELEATLWNIAAQSVREEPTSQGAALLAASLNDVFDLQSDRLAVGARDRIPGAIWIALYLLTSLCMVAVGYHAGMLGSVRILPLAALVFAFSTVVLLIADLDRPQQGFLRVTQQPLEDVARDLVSQRG